MLQRAEQPATWAATQPREAEVVGRQHIALSAICVAVGYYALATVGTVLSVPPSGFAIIWPATAFLVGVLLLAPVRSWWIYLLAAVPTHFHMIGSFQDVPVLVGVTQISGNISLAAITAFAVRSAHATPLRFDRFHEVLKFVLVAGVAVPAVVNAAILSLHLQTGWANDFWLSWRQWMLASVFPAVTIPPLMVLTFHRVGYQRELTSRFSAEVTLVAALLLAVSFPVFGWASPQPEYLPTLLLAPIPLLLWAAIRLGVGGTCFSLLALAGVILGGALAGRGPFAHHSPIEDVLSLQVFLITISIPLILLAALAEERRQTAQALQQSEARMRMIAASTDTGLWQYDLMNNHLWATEHCRSMFGLDSRSVFGPQAFLDAVHPEDRAAAMTAMRMAARDQAPEPGEFRVVHPEGQIRWYLAASHVERDEHGQETRVSGMFTDITKRRIAEQETAQLSERLLGLQDEERQRIAEELHDSTSQHLAAIGLNLISVRAHAGVDSPASQMLDEMDDSLAEASKELRTFTYLLHPPLLEAEGLRATLERYIEGFGRRTNLRMQVNLSASADRISPAAQRAVLRVVQEALTNVHRHAQATRVLIAIRRTRKHLHLLIRDNGKGLAPASKHKERKLPSLGVGITGMTSRMQSLRGGLTLRSSGTGTTVHAVLPMDG
jgi:PAS domain S-box-containing protein